MRSLLLAALAVLLVGVAGAGAGSGATGTSAPAGLARGSSLFEHVPGELIVRFKSGVGASARTSTLAAEGAHATGNLGLPGLTSAKLTPGSSMDDAVAALEDDPDVLYAEPNYVNHVDVLPNDPSFGKLYGLSQPSGHDIDAPSAWNTTTGSSDVVVAVVDSGMAYNHPDLKNNVWVNADEIPGNGLDDDANGYVDDVRGWDFVDDDNAPLDFLGHGTHVSGTIGAQGNNHTGVTGVNWDVSIMPLRAGDANGSLPNSAIVDAINYACANGADVVNGSFGSEALAMSISDAVKSAPCANTLFVFAAGNEGKNLEPNGAANNDYPCELHRSPANGGTSAANVLCVAATDAKDHLAGFSNYGATAVHLAGPGVNILSTWPAWSSLPGFPETYEGSNSKFDSRWGNRTGGAPKWNRTKSHKKFGKYSLTDSPNGNYSRSRDRTIRRLAPFSLAGRAGCQVENWLRLDAEPQFDFFDVKAGTLPSAATFVGSWTGGTGGKFVRVTDDLSAFDGEGTVYLRLGLFSDSAVNFDGAYVDNTAVRCLKNTAAAYKTISGTSMATPHVAGVAALALANDPSLTVAQLKDAILNGVDTISRLAGKVSTGGRLNAAKTLGLVPDDARPNTTITGGPPHRTHSHKATFTFTGSEAGVRFDCKLDTGGWQSCSSAKKYKHLKTGKHTFQARAMDENGNADGSPATRNWRVV